MSDTVSERTTSEQMEGEDQRITARQKKTNWRGHNGQANSGLSAQAKKEQNYELIKKEGVLVTPPCSRCDTPARRDKGVQCIMAAGLSSRCAECYKHNYVCDKKDWIPPPGQPRPEQTAAQALAHLAQGTPKARAPQPGINGGGVQTMRRAATQNEGELSPEDVLSPRMGQMNLIQKRTPLPSGPPPSMAPLNVIQQRSPLPRGPPATGEGRPGLRQVRPVQSGARSPQNLGVGLKPYNGPMPGGPAQFMQRGQGHSDTPTLQGPLQVLPNTSGPQNEPMAPPNRQMAASSSQIQQGSPFSNGYRGGMDVLASGFAPGDPNQQSRALHSGGMIKNGFPQGRLNQQGQVLQTNSAFSPVGTFTTSSHPALASARKNGPKQQGPAPPNNGFKEARPLAQVLPTQVQTPQPQPSNPHFQLRRSTSQQFNLLSYSAFPEQDRVVEINNPGQYPAFEVVVDGVRHYAAILTPVRGNSPMIGQQQLPQNGQRQKMQGAQQFQNGENEPNGPDGTNGRRSSQGPQMQNIRQGQQKHLEDRGPQGPQSN